MALTCRICERSGTECTCSLTNKINDVNNMYPHKGMAPVEVDNPINKAWRQVRDQANKDVATRMSVIEHREAIETRAKEIEVEMVEMMTLGGLHPNTRNCVDDYS